MQQMDTFAFHPDLLYVCPFEGLTKREMLKVIQQAMHNTLDYSSLLYIDRTAAFLTKA